MLDVKKKSTQKLYHEYQLNWMKDHGYSIYDLIQALDDYQKNNPTLLSIKEIYHNWEYDCGFYGEIFACFDEFIQNEYQERTNL